MANWAGGRGRGVFDFADHGDVRADPKPHAHPRLARCPRRTEISAAAFMSNGAISAAVARDRRTDGARMAMLPVMQPALLQIGAPMPLTPTEYSSFSKPQPRSLISSSSVFRASGLVTVLAV